MSVEQLVQMFKLDAFSQPNVERALLESLQKEVGEHGEFLIEYGPGYYMRNSGEFDVKVKIPGYMNFEQFRGTELRPLLVKAICYRRWCATEIGRKALEALE